MFARVSGGRVSKNSRRSAGSSARDDGRIALAGLLFPNREIANAKVVAVVAEQFLKAGAGDVSELDFGFVRGRGPLLPSRMFCFPERADWIIWSMVPSPLVRYLWAKRKVRS